MAFAFQDRIHKNSMFVNKTKLHFIQKLLFEMVFFSSVFTSTITLVDGKSIFIEIFVVPLGFYISRLYKTTTIKFTHKRNATRNVRQKIKYEDDGNNFSYTRAHFIFFFSFLLYFSSLILFFHQTSNTANKIDATTTTVER